MERKEIDNLILYAKERIIFDVDRDIFSAIKKSIRRIKNV